MKIIILASRAGAFYDQAQGLGKGLEKIGLKAEVYPKAEENPAIPISSDDVVIGVGSWRNWPELYQRPRHKTTKILPWLVSDDKVLDYVQEINQLPCLYTTSRFCQKTFVKWGVKKEIIKIIPEGIDTDFWRPLPQKKLAVLLKDIPLPQLQNQLVFLTMGGDGTSKGAQEVIESLAKLHLNNFLYLLKISKTPDGLNNMKKEISLAEKLGIKDQLHYIIGRFSQEQILALFNLADVYVAPSRHEGFGLPHIQAMACEKPVITCKGTAAEETSLPGKTGFVVNSETFSWTNASGYTVNGVRANTQELSEAIKKIAFDASLRKKMGQQARKHIREKYECQKIAEEFFAEIKKNTL